MFERNAAVLTAFLSLLVAPVGATPALAHGPATEAAGVSQRCSCPLPVAARGTVGRVVSATGDVLVSQAGGFGAATSGASLSLGSQILVGPAGSASVVFGRACALNLQSNASVRVERSNGKLCVRVLDRTSTASISGGTSTTFARIVTQGAMGGTMAGLLAVGVGHQISVSH